MIMCLIQMGYMEKAQPSWSEMLWGWKHAVFHQLTWPWSWDKDLRPRYDIHLWTIPIEFAHSMLLFMVILMLSRVRLRIRQASVFGLMGYSLACGKWAAFEFMGGMFLAELHVLRSARPLGWESPQKYLPSQSRVLGWIKIVLHITIILVGLFIGGWPNRDADKTPGIRYFLEKTPYPFTEMDHLAPQKFWFGLSAVFMVWSVGEIHCLRGLFESSVAQYCGRVSYAVYICHGAVLALYEKRVLGVPPVLVSGESGSPNFGETIPGWGVKGWVGIANATQMMTGWFVGLCILGPLVIWAADLFWRAIDDPVVKLGRKLELACLDDREDFHSLRGY